MSGLVTILAFLLALAVLVVFHELGHFLAARLAGVKVLRFSVGFGRPVLRHVAADGVEWVLSAIPLGGYVKMLDEHEGPVAPAEAHRAFNRASVGRRLFIVAAGPLANFLLAVLLYWVMFVHGVPALKPVIDAPPRGSPAALAGLVRGDEIARVDDEHVASFGDLRMALLAHGVGTEAVRLMLSDGQVARLSTAGIGTIDPGSDVLAALGLRLYEPRLPAVIGRVMPGSPAERAGLARGDRIAAVNGTTVGDWQGLVEAVQASPGKPVQLLVTNRQGSALITLTPERITQDGHTIGRIGAAPEVPAGLFAPLRTELRYGPLDALGQAAAKTWDLSVFSLEMLGRMLVGEVSWKNLSGPLTIADYAGQSAEMGWLPYLAFLSIVSISLGVLNLLPIPLLDGGHLMYYIFESVRGKPVSERAMEIATRIGMGILMVLVTIALYNDFQRILSG